MPILIRDEKIDQQLSQIARRLQMPASKTALATQILRKAIRQFKGRESKLESWMRAKPKERK